MGGMFCLKKGGLVTGGDGSRLAITLVDTRLFLSGLDALLLAESLLLRLLFMACLVCRSVVCLVCRSEPCLVSRSVMPWIAL